MSCVHRLLTVVMLLILGSARVAFAQDVSATLGVTRTMKSTILGEDRKVFVRQWGNRRSDVASLITL
jgi:hypothetical protein